MAKIIDPQPGTCQTANEQTLKRTVQVEVIRYSRHVYATQTAESDAGDEARPAIDIIPAEPTVKTGGD